MGLFSWIGDIVSDVFGGTTGRKDQQKYNVQNMAIQQDYARQNMADQNYYNVQAFERENAYNSPLAQQQRNYAAGINPMWSDAGQVVGQQDSAVTASAPAGGIPTAGNTDFLGSIAQLLGLKEQIKTQQSQQELNKANTRKAHAEANSINERLPWDIENVQANAQKLLASAFKDEQEATYYKQYLDKMFEHWEYENMSLDEQIKIAYERLPHEIDKLDAEAQQAMRAAVLSYVLAKFKPKEVAIAQQNANSNTTNAKANSVQATASVMQAKTAQWKAEHEWTLGLIHENNVHEMNKIMEGHYFRIDDMQQQAIDIDRTFKEKLGDMYEKQGKNLDAHSAILAYDEAVLRYRRYNHLDTQMEELKLEMFREGINNLRLKGELTKANIEKLEMEVNYMPLKVLGETSGSALTPDLPSAPRMVGKSRSMRGDTWYEQYHYEE